MLRARRVLLLVSGAGLAACLGLLFLTQSILVAYGGLVFLAMTTVVYLLPEESPGRSLVFPRGHPYFRFIRVLDAASIPSTFFLVFAGILAVAGRAWWILLLLAAVRMLPSLAISKLIHSRSSRLLSMPGTPIGEMAECGMCHITGFVFETRMRRRRGKHLLYNVWMVDSRGVPAFIPGMAEVRGTTERVSEGARCSVVGPSTLAFGIRAIQPVVSVVLPAGWEGSDSDWHEIIWRRTRTRRLATAGVGSIIYAVAILVMAGIAGMLDGGNPLLAAAILSFLAAAFFGALTEKNYREANSYEVESYFEPKWTGLPPEARKKRLETVRRKAKLGHLPGEYVDVLEGMEDRAARS